MSKKMVAVLVCVVAVVVLLAGYVGGSYMYVGKSYKVPEAKSIDELRDEKYFGEFTASKDIYIIDTNKNTSHPSTHLYS